jgi:ankyrin repeat protein
MAEKLSGSKIMTHIHKVMRIFHKPKTEMIKLSPEKQQKINSKLFDAARNGNNSETERLLKKGANANARNGAGETALMIAAFQGHTKTCAILLEKGADIDAKNSYGETALTIAQMHNKKETEELLKKAEKAKAKG